MPIFICDKCGVIENTACCSYWTLAMERHRKNKSLIWSQELKEFEGSKCLCSECADLKFSPDGRKAYVVPGRWHDKFPKEYPSKEKIYKMRKQNQIIN